MTNQAASRITILYDDRCALCCRFCQWIEKEPALLEIRFLSMHGSETRQRYPSLAAQIEDDQFLVVDNLGQVYRGTNARIIILYALARYRSLSFKLARPAWFAIADRIFEFVSARRHVISSWLASSDANAARDALDRAERLDRKLSCEVNFSETP